MTIDPWMRGMIIGVAVACLVAFYGIVQIVRKRAWFLRALAADAAPAESRDASGKIAGAWVAAGFAVLLLAVIILERNQPYYFTTDDNFCQGLPVTLQACRSFFSGVFPQWNPYQLLGAPTACLGVYCLTYPPTYIGYAIARYVLGNEYYTMEVIAVLDLFGGFLATYWAARAWRISPALSVAAALSFMLSGFTLISGRSWGNLLNAVGWLPLLFGAIGVLVRGPVTWRWVVGVGLVVGLFFHAGFVQWWVYGLLFFALVLAILILTGALPLRRALWSVPAVLLGIAIAAPLLYVQMDFASGIARSDSGGGVRLPGMLAMLLPYPLVRAAHPQGYTSEYYSEYMGQFYYSGTIFCGVALLAVASVIRVRWSKRVIAGNVFLFCAALALVFSLGDRGGLWTLLCKTPWLGKFKNAERFLGLFNCFVALGGALVLHRWLGEAKRRRWWEGGLVAVLAVLLLYHVNLARSGFWLFDDKPYPAMPAEIADRLRVEDPLKPQRVASLVPMDRIPFRIYQRYYSLSMEHNFASVYTLPSMNGYDPLIWDHEFFQRYIPKALGQHGSVWDNFEGALLAESRNRGERCKAYGIRWQVLYGPLSLFFCGVYPEICVFQGGPPLLHIRDVADAAPLAFLEARPGEACPIRLDGRGAAVDTAQCSEGGPFIINVLAWPDFKVYAEGVRIPFEPDEWGRMRLSLPPGVTRLEAVYSPPWGRGILLGGALAALAAILAVLQARFASSR